MRLALLLFIALFTAVGAAQTPKPSTYRWTQFVQVEGQPEPVPAEWVSTPEGKFAHSIKIPNPVPQDSGYRLGLTSEQYFEHLCNTQAGEFIYKRVEGVEGFYFMRPPTKPTDKDLMDRYKLEAPDIESPYQLRRATPEERALTFINPPWSVYSYVEEPDIGNTGSGRYFRIFGYSQDVSPMQRRSSDELQSHYGLTWRGIRREGDRELNTSGGEWILINLNTKEVMAVFRDFVRSGLTRNTPDRLYWVTAGQCPRFKPTKSDAGNHQRLYRFVSEVLKPSQTHK
jgi:hypothetical protein